MDLSTFSTEDLKALRRGDLSGVSTEGLERLRASMGQGAGAPAAAPTERPYADQMLRNVAGGVVSGLGSIGSTVLRGFGEAEKLGGTLLGLPPFLSNLGAADRTAEESARRRALIEQFVTERMGAEPSAIGRTVGKLGTEVAGTAGAGPLMAPAAATRFPAFARALETGGFAGGGMAPRVAGGATVGGVSAGLVDPSDLAAGGTFGGTIPFLMGGAAKFAGRTAGAVTDVLGRGLPFTRASAILRESIGEQNLPNAMAALRAARPEGIPDEALVGVSRPAFLSLVDLAAKKDRDSTINALRDLQHEDMFNELARIAGGFTQAEAFTTARGTHQNLRGYTRPSAERALAGAREGAAIPSMEREVAGLQSQAAQEVENVRRLERARSAAEARSGQGYPIGGAGIGTPDFTGAPRIPGRYTYSDELEKLADRMMDDAASGSLNFGAAARLRQADIDALTERGIAPLRTDDLLQRIQALGARDETAGNREFSLALRRVMYDIQQWTNADGVISPTALEAIRKNSVNSVVQQLYKGASEKAQRKVASGILSEIKPVIDDAIEAAGGRGWRDYMRAFESGMDEVKQQQFAAKALALFPKDRANSAEEYIRLVRGDRLKDLDQVFGKGNYDIVRLMGARYPTLDKLATAMEQQGAIKTAVERGSVPIREILQEHKGLFKLPAFFDPTITTGNRVLQILGAKVDTKTMDVVMKAVRTNADLLEALQNVPASQRNRVLRALSDDRSWMPAATAPITSAGAIMSGED